MSVLGLPSEMLIEYIMVSQINLEMFEPLSKATLEVDQQTYEDVPGFQSLRKIFYSIY